MIFIDACNWLACSDYSNMAAIKVIVQKPGELSENLVKIIPPPDFEILLPTPVVIEDYMAVNGTIIWDLPPILNFDPRITEADINVLFEATENPDWVSWAERSLIFDLNMLEKPANVSTELSVTLSDEFERARQYTFNVSYQSDVAL